MTLDVGTALKKNTSTLLSLQEQGEGCGGGGGLLMLNFRLWIKQLGALCIRCAPKSPYEFRSTSDPIFSIFNSLYV